MPSATPLRSLGHLDDAGLRVLSDPGLGYADGAEATLAEIVGAAQDLSSTSRELADQATDWATTYHLGPSRANVLRALDLPRDARVLEIGCGCGALTRYLGERCATVDSVEPMPARARVAALRTRDLDGVQVHVGTLEDVPREPAYDVVVVVGVLEYVGLGTADPQPYLDFLARCHDVLVDGGTLVLAIENALGVKYLAGAGEDHSNRPFDSLEDYLLESPARTFSRRRLEGLVGQAGLVPATLGAFPDYKMTRVVVADGLAERSSALAERLPRFPSPDWVVPRLPLADEASLWRQLVGAGVGDHFANSLVVLAGKGGPSSIWPDDRLAVMYAGDRQPEYVVRTEVVAAGDGVELRRTATDPERAAVPHPDVRHAPPAVELESDGAELLQLTLEQPARRGELLRAWAELVPDTEWMPVDLVPHNVIVAPDGALRVVDQEWQVRGVDRDVVLVRGLLWGAVRLAQMTRPAAGEGSRTIRELMEDLAGDLGLTLTDDLMQRFVAQESRFQAAVNTSHHDEEDRLRHAAQDLWATIGRDVLSVRGGPRLDQVLAERDGELERQAAELHHRGEIIHALEAQVAALHRRLDASLDERLRRRLGPVVRRVRARSTR